MKACVLALCLAASALPHVADAQRGNNEVRRPRLAAQADTNDSVLYLELGMSSINENAETAADAFYWASRLDPSSAGALYGRAVANIMRRQQLLTQYYEGGRRARENRAEFLASDTLQARALKHDPLMFRMLDRAMIFTYFYNNYRRSGGDLTRREFDREISFELQGYPPATRAFVYYGMGQFDQAVTEYDAAIRSSRDPASLRISRARALALRSRDREAIEEFGRAIEALKTRDERRGEFVVFYDSKALLQHSIGVLHARQKSLDSARAAFGRAMEEDVSFWPPHVELGRLALSQNDSVTAVSELGLAAELATDEPYIHYMYGEMLHATGQHAEAIEALRKAIAMEAFYAAPHFVLAQALEKTGDAAAAKTHYERYLALSPRRETANRNAATARLAALGR